MNTNEELKTRPDFEKLALDYTNDNGKYNYCSKGNHDHDCGCGHYEEGYKSCWTTHVEPLQAENQKLRGAVKALIPMAKDGVRFSEKAGAHLVFMSDDREEIAKAESLLRIDKD